MGLLCKVFGHKAIQPFPGMPAFCKRCKVDLRWDGRRYVEDDSYDALFNRFTSQLNKNKEGDDNGK